MLHWWTLMMMKAGREDHHESDKNHTDDHAGFFAVTIPVYWFNLDTKLVKLIEKPMMKHYDSMPRDNRL